MAVNVAVVKTPAGTLALATAYDAELLRDYAAGRQLKVEIKQMGNRSYQHHYGCPRFGVFIRQHNLQHARLAGSGKCVMPI